MSDISTTFNSVVTGIKQQMKDTNHQSAVDVELNFTSLEIKAGGIPLISKKSKKKEMTIKLATRILPE